MHLRTVAVATSLAATLLAFPAPAHARSLSVPDEAGDTIDRGLDITSVTFKNRDKAVVVGFEFTRDRRGEVIVAMGARRGPSVRIISQHPRTGRDNTFLIDRSGDEVPCEKLSSDWDRAAATLKLRMPAECLGSGNYGALRFWALTEGYPGSGSSDVDYAPETPDGGLGLTARVPRG